MTGLQISALVLYENFMDYVALCYLPILTVRNFSLSMGETDSQLPKVYTITLILSVSLPQSQSLDHRLSGQILSLPVIRSVDHLSSPQHAPLPHVYEKDFVAEQCRKKPRSYSPGTTERISAAWRRSQEWLSWSLIGTVRGPTPPAKEGYEKRLSEDLPVSRAMMASHRSKADTEVAQANDS